MSEINNTNSLVDDDVFTAFFEKAKADAKAAAEKKNQGQSFTREYEDVEWVGLEQDQFKIVRIVGAPPSSMTGGRPTQPTDAQEIWFSTIKDDSGKRIQLKLPPKADDLQHSHIMWRIINAVKEVDWVKNEKTGKKEKVFKYADKPWFDTVTHGGFDPVQDEFQYKISKGWQGQEVVIMNVIDREDNWCKEHKHTKLLSKKINKSKDGTTEYPTVGVPSYGFITLLANLCGQYRSWEGYDLAIRRTGQTNPPYEVKAATIYANAGLAANEVGEEKMKYISKDTFLTDEEKSWKRYEISKLYAPTTYNKILTHLGNTIKAIDADLKRNFYEELQGLAEREKKEFEEKYGNSNVEASDVDVPTEEDSPLDESNILAAPANTSAVAQTSSAPIQETVNPTPTVGRTIVQPTPTATVSAGLSADKIALLKGWSLLSPEEQAQIKDVVLNGDGTIKEIVYSESSAPGIQCIDEKGQGCGYYSPSDFSHCPVCGASYVD